MNTNRTNYKTALIILKGCLHIIKDFGGKDRKIVITSDSVRLMNGAGIELFTAGEIAEYLDTIVEQYYNEP